MTIAMKQMNENDTENINNNNNGDENCHEYDRDNCYQISERAINIYWVNTFGDAWAGRRMAQSDHPQAHEGKTYSAGLIELKDCAVAMVTYYAIEYNWNLFNNDWAKLIF